jgi:TonB family protein
VVGTVAAIVVIIAAIALWPHKTPQPEPDAQTTSQPATPAEAPPQRTTKPQTLKGSVAERAIPDVPGRASRTIRGKVDVRVRVSVDPNGVVSNATFDREGPSRYFGNIALETARKWRFKPPQVDGHPVASVWILRFDFRQTKTDVTPVEVTP